jgi:hypothetical protein
VWLGRCRWPTNVSDIGKREVNFVMAPDTEAPT